MDWFNHVAYGACLYLIARNCIGQARGVSDALALNWAAGLLSFTVMGGSISLPLYILIDFLTALWLLSALDGKTARTVALLHIPAIVANGALYIGHDGFNLAGLSLNTWSWLQMAALIFGAWDDGLGQMVDRLSNRLRGGRDLDAGLSSMEEAQWPKS